jgi:hypothetical protein
MRLRTSAIEPEEQAESDGLEPEMSVAYAELNAAAVMPQFNSRHRPVQK